MAGVSRYSDGVGAEALVLATGKTAEQWLVILDDVGASTMGHTAIARWLGDNHPEIGGWWAQGVTVMFEQERGLRLPGQQADGTFSVSASKSFAESPDTVLARAVDAVDAIVGSPPTSYGSSQKRPSARWALEGEHILLASVDPTKTGKVRLTLTRSRIADSADVDDAKRWVKAAVDHVVGPVAD